MILQVGFVQAEPLSLDVNDGIDDTLDVGLTGGVIGHREEIDVACLFMLTCV